MLKFFGILQRSGKLMLDFPKSISIKLDEGTFKFSPEVSGALSRNLPIVALESTLITHGLPYPVNKKTACKLEDIVKDCGAVPATIGVIDGDIHIGMEGEKIEFLAAQNKNTVKISRRDLPYVLSKGLSGGTTVAATMALAYRAGIPVFVTGGIGGVHRGAETSMDISADLYELSRTPMTVVSAGVKSILDIGLTLEHLETLGVCVAAFGPSKVFPSFFTPESKFSAACNVETCLDAARLIDSRDLLKLESGLLLAVPIPDKYHDDGFQTEAVIEKALTDAREQNIKGKDVTPYVLGRVRELSSGASLRANIGLLENNARIGSRIAVELNALKNRRNKVPSSSSAPIIQRPVSCSSRNASTDVGRPVVIGGSNLDIQAQLLEDVKLDGSTLPGIVESAGGGVGRNIADCLTRLGCNPLLISAVGAKEHAESLFKKMQHMDKQGIKLIPDERTATVVVVLDKRGEYLFGVGDMDIHNKITPEFIKSQKSYIAAAPLVIVDGNVSVEAMGSVFKICNENKVPVWFEPTDMSKASKPFQTSTWKSVLNYASPNLKELRSMHRALLQEDIQYTSDDSDLTMKGNLDKSLELGFPLVEKRHLHTLLVTLGAHGVLLLTASPSSTCFPIKSDKFSKDQQVRAVHYPAPKVSKIASVSGAGDCFAAGMIAGILRRMKQDECIKIGQRVALLSLASSAVVPESITPEVFKDAGTVLLPPPSILI